MVTVGTVFHFPADSRIFGNINNTSKNVLITLTVSVVSLSSAIENLVNATLAFATTASTRGSSASLDAKALTES